MQTCYAYILSFFVSCALLYGTVANGTGCFSAERTVPDAETFSTMTAADSGRNGSAEQFESPSLASSPFTEALLQETLSNINISAAPRTSLRPVFRTVFAAGRTAVRFFVLRRGETVTGGVSAGCSRSSRPLWLALGSLLI